MSLLHLVDPGRARFANHLISSAEAPVEAEQWTGDLASLKATFQPEANKIALHCQSEQPCSFQQNPSLFASTKVCFWCGTTEVWSRCSRCHQVSDLWLGEDLSWIGISNRDLRRLRAWHGMQVSYCCKEHQRKDWPTHRTFCQLGPSRTLRLTFEVLLLLSH